MKLSDIELSKKVYVVRSKMNYANIIIAVAQNFQTSSQVETSRNEGDEGDD